MTFKAEKFTLIHNEPRIGGDGPPAEEESDDSAMTDSTGRASLSEDEEDQQQGGTKERQNGAVPADDNHKKLGVASLTAIMFYTVSGGPFGAEETVRSAGALFTLLGFLITPLLWSFPEALMSAELACAFPEAAGSVAWIEHAFGPAVAWQAGFLGWMSGVTDNAIYPVLFLDYLLQVIDGAHWVHRVLLHPLCRFAFLSGTSIVLAFINWMGLSVVGNMSMTICFVTMSPFLVFSVIGAFQMKPERWFQVPFSPEQETIAGAENGAVGTFRLIATALGGIMWRPFLNNLFWNISSFDSVGNFAADVQQPVGRVLPRALLWTIAMASTCSFFPLLVALGASDAPQSEWVDGSFARVATDVVGPWLGAWLVFAAGLSNLGLFQAELSSDAYQLAGMADRGYLPKWFQTRSRFGTPTAGIVVGTTIIVTLCSTSDFGELLEYLNFNYSISLLVEYAAFVKLRVSQPNLPRPYRVPLGTAGCVIMFAPTVAMMTIVMALATRKTILFSICANGAGILIYVLARCRATLYAEPKSKAT